MAEWRDQQLLALVCRSLSKPSKIRKESSSTVSGVCPGPLQQTGMLFWNKTDAFAIVEEAHASESTLPVGMRGFSDIFFLCQPQTTRVTLSSSNLVQKINREPCIFALLPMHDRVYRYMLVSCQRVDITNPCLHNKIKITLTYIEYIMHRLCMCN